ncbi:MAG TPA: hypothetical protein VNI61_08340 [Gemmatimonadales bacterium]|nr:hypothetical protein [Gemmatimonadales bacterium]
MTGATRAAAAAGLLAILPGLAPAQGYRLRLDTRWQTAAYRGVALDSIPVGDTVTGPGTGPSSPDGYAVQCRAGAAYCTFFRPGPTRRGGPVTSTASLTVWGLGLPGLSVHAVGRLGLDVGATDGWPGTAPAVQLLEGYAEYAVARATARLGRQVVASRLGTTGFDGAGLVVRDPRLGAEVRGYLGWGLARGAAIPVTSPALNPLDDFQPRRRQIVAGFGAGWSASPGDVWVEYQREVDPQSAKFVSERIGVDAVLRPLPGVRVGGGADYDLAAGWWGSAEASLGYSTGRLRATIGARRYRPHFDLWTIWGAFSPVPYRAVRADAAVALHPRLELRGGYERYVFDAAEAATPLFQAEDDGWRWELGATLRPRPQWTLDAGYRREFGPGAAAAGLAGGITYRPSRRFSATLLGSSANRPLEFRFNEALVRAYGLDAEIEPSPRLRVGLTASLYDERRRRPDAAAFDWDQFRATARLVLFFSRGAEADGLPPAIRLLPGGRSAR